ncbi:CTP synthase (glutamine hydrolyzing) [Candidatus Woesearchaeota archaeon]|nr:CTP synthase (glutamine hydrolyzing) [Candidatus Woesearchaeota archaeon]
MSYAKFIIVTGGVLSGLGKGIISASIARLLSSSNRIVTIKCDGYLNVDPGTMNPIEHGEVFVLDDGGEVDLDFGHYERFLNIDAKFTWNLTSGKIFKEIIDKERKGDYLGKTVQMIPHVTDLIKSKFFQIAKSEDADIVLIEMGGTIGDMEMMLFNEAARQLKMDVGADNILYVHLTYVPELECVGEQKSKPTQQSTELLRKIGIQPNIIIGRSRRMLDDDIKEKIALFSNIDKAHVVSDPDIQTVYELPLIFQKEGLPYLLRNMLKVKDKANLTKWSRLVSAIKNPKHEVTIAICGKYTKLHDSYLSISEALVHAGAHYETKVHLKWLETTDIENGRRTVEESLKGIDGVIVPGGFGSRGTEGKIEVIRYARENKIPFLGICLGFQLAVIEFARNVCGLKKANSTEIADTPEPVICLLPEQMKVETKGGTMRLGGRDIRISKDSQAYKIYNAESIRERFRHRYEVNPEYVETLEKKGIVFSGTTPDKSIMQIMELPDHPCYVSGQYHPELSSRLERPAPLFLNLVKAARSFAEHRSRTN